MSKTVLITGSTDGIGQVVAEKLVQQGHRVLIHGRNAEKLKAVEAKLNAVGSGSVESYSADLSDFSDVEALANAVAQDHPHLDVLINNAGIYRTNQPDTKYGLDVRFVVNTLAPYLLTRRLLRIMDNAGRIINLSSAAQAPVKLAAMTGAKSIGDESSAYAQSKLAITMWSRHMALALGENAPVIVAVNPGSLLASKMVKEGYGVEGKDINIGADILVTASLADEFANASGLYFDNDAGKFSAPHPDGLDAAKCSELVKTIDELLGGVGFTVPA
ncbi:MAG: SDR family NAD(P)-dependent oxidoreductase [Pseudomonadales bacterium]|nr:SDR family NAD(P)-dependent oxidoreductase [Pseudomonadales bacterium]